MGRSIYCSVCECHRDEHTPLFGKQCKMPPLDPEVLEELRASRRAAEELEVAKKTALPEKDDDYASELELTEDDLDDAELEAQVAALEKQKKELQAAQKEASGKVADQERKNRKKAKLAKLQAEVADLNKSIAESQDRLKALKLEVA